MLLLYSCTTTQVDQIKNVEISQKYFIDVSVKDLSNASGSIDLEYVNFDTPIAFALKDSINAGLISKGFLKDPNIPRLRLDIIIRDYDKGKAAARWVLPGLGETRLNIEAILYDQDNKAISQARVSRKVSWGGLYTIGAGNRAFDKVATSLLNIILNN